MVKYSWLFDIKWNCKLMQRGMIMDKMDRKYIFITAMAVTTMT